MAGKVILTQKEGEEEEEREGRLLQRFIPARVLFVLLGFMGFNLVYAYKTVLSMSIIAMVNGTAENNARFPGVKVEWDHQQQSQVLGSFFYGYVVTQIPAAVLATKFGGKWIFGCALLLTGIMSILGPFTAPVDYKLFMATRIIQGLAEGVAFPVMNGMIAQWIPKNERSRGTTIIFTGAMIGTVLTLPITAMLSKTHFLGGWPATFYLLGLAGVVWFILWAVLVYESPEGHPFISSRERRFITTNGGGLKAKGRISIPVREILSSYHVYALIVTHFGQNWGFLTVLNLMPTYMNTVLEMNINENILISGMPYLGQAIWGWGASFITDKLRQNGRFTITTLRKANSFIAYVPSGICLALVPVIKHNTTGAAILLILAMTFNGSCHPGLNSTHGDMSPRYAGVLMGITNGLGNIPGFLATIVAGQFTKNGDTVENWAPVFYLSAAVFGATTLVYCFLCTAEEQPWGRAEKPQTTPSLDIEAEAEAEAEADQKRRKEAF